MPQKRSSAFRLRPEKNVAKLCNDGFLVLESALSIREQISRTLEAGFEFFRASLDEKNANRLGSDCGYRPIGIEYSQSPQRPDRIESFSACAKPRNPESVVGSTRGRLLYERLSALIDVLEPIAEELTIQLADAFGGTPSAKRLRGSLHRWSCLQMNYARPAEVLGEFINEPHEDGHLITIACATGPGLEIYTTEHGFQPLVPGHHQFVVMPGEIAYLLSGGRIRPLYHCVKCDRTLHERMSLLFFADIDPRLCVPWSRNEVNANVDIGARVLTNATRFGLHALEMD